MSIRPRSTIPLPFLVLALASCSAAPELAGTDVAEVRTDPPPGDPGPAPEPAPPPQVTVSPQGPTAISVRYQCAGWVERHEPSGARVVIPTPCTFTEQVRGWTVHPDSPLQQGTRYCYVAFNVDGLSSPEACLTTPWAPYVFNGPGISQAESDQMVAAFDWRHTEPLPTTFSTASGLQPTVYSMNLLVNTEEDFLSIRSLGIHTQQEPLFEPEQQAWTGEVVMARVQGAPVGAWITAIVPGAVYNEIRTKAIAGLASGHPIGLRAAVFHRNPVAEASLIPLAPDLAPLNLVYLTQQGLELNGYSLKTCNDDGTCTVQQAFLGWLARKFVNFSLDIARDAYHAVRQAVGGIEKQFREDHPVTLHLRVNNTDPKFGYDQEATSGWSGAPLKLSGIKVRVYQGNFSEFTGTTDATGSVTITLLGGLAGRVYIDLANDHVDLINSFSTRKTRIGTFPALGSQSSVFVVTNDKWANELLAMTDAHDYVKTVLGYDVDKVSVLTGWNSTLFTGTVDHSFTPCLGRFPNLSADLVDGWLPNLVPIVPVLNEIAEFTLGSDIVMYHDDVESRGLGVHEYGHAVMCDMMRSLDHLAASDAWNRLTIARINHENDPNEPAGVLGEAFADFIALQVVGGTNYATGAGVVTSGAMRYCDGSSTTANACLEPNSVRCEGAGCSLGDNVRWATSVLQDAFDDVAADPANPPIDRPNDGSHWQDVGGTLLHHRAANQVSSTDADAIHLTSSGLRSMLAKWLSSGGAWSYAAFFGHGLAGTLARDGFTRADGCAMYAAHEPGGACPDYFANELTP